MSQANGDRAPEFSIIICTYNRSRLLSDALESILNLSEEGLSVTYEVVVVDNSSADDTKEIVEEFARRAWFPVRYTYEPIQGLSYARNAGIRKAKGIYVVFIDDDCTVHPNWLSSLMDSIIEHKCDIAQGKILLNTDGINLPSWIDDEDKASFGYFDLGDQVVYTDIILGGNMCIKKALFEKHGMFDVQLGEGASGRCEDTEFIRRVRNEQTDLRVLYVPGAVVYHRLRQERLTKESVLDLYYRNAYSLALIRDDMKKGFRATSSLRKKILIRFLKSMIYAFAGDGLKKHKQQKRIAVYRGKMRALRGKP